MKQYPKYKDSGIQWIGQVPEHWGKCRVKEVSKLVNGYPFQSNTYCDAGKWNIVTISNVQSEKFDITGCKTINILPTDIQTSQKLSKGDLLISMTGNVGRVCFVDKENCLLNQRVGKLEVSSNVDKSFLLYVLANPNFVSFLQQRSQSTAQLNIGKEDIGMFPIPLPPLSEQQAIANYLDEKTGKIDASIESLEQQKADLQKYRASLISETVTRGLDPKAKLKDSGVQWIGQIPVGWSFTKLKYLTSKIGSGVTPTGGATIYQDSGVLFIRSQNVYPDGLRLDDVAYISDAIDNGMQGSRVQKGDVLLNITGASIGRCTTFELDDTRANVNQHVCIIRPIETVLISKYLQYLLNSQLGQTQITKYQTGGNREGLNFEQIKSFLVPMISLSEQQAIADYLDEKTAKMDKAIATIDEQISDLRAFRTSLITEAVTGKIRV